MVNWLLCRSLLQFCSTWIFKERCKVHCRDFDGLWKIHPLDRKHIAGEHGRHGSVELQAQWWAVCGGGGGIWIKQQTKKQACVKGKNKTYLHFELFFKFSGMQTCKNHLWTLGGRPYPQTSVRNQRPPPALVRHIVLTEMHSEKCIIRRPYARGCIPGCTCINLHESLLHAEAVSVA